MGAHTLAVEIRDLAGNITTASSTFLVEAPADATPPTLTIEGATTREVAVGQPLELVAVVEDDGLLKARRRW